MYNEGDIVLLTGLKSKPTWNGRKATVIGSFQWQQARYPIQITNINYNNDNDSKQEHKAPDTDSDTKITALIKPSNLKLISRNKHKNNINDSLFEIKRIDNDRGYGMFALKDIPSGTIILMEKPIINLPKEQYRNGQSSQQWINQQFELLTNNDKKKVLELHDNVNNNNNNNNNCVGVYRTNAYMFTDDEQYESGLFLTISRINHSCFPNSILVDGAAKNGVNINKIIALFGINKGEEITHSYIDLGLFMSGFQKRQKYIMDNYGFICKCNECINFKKRDQFRKKYKDLENEIEKSFQQMNVDKILECSTKMVDILKKHFNGYPPFLSQAYMKLAESKLHLGQYDDVVNCMKRSAKMDLKYYGDECDMNDIIQCKILLPTKYQNAYPWDHVLGKSKPTL